MRVYLAGPMSGKPLYNFAAFDEAAAHWRGNGHDVSSPADITRGLYWERFGRMYDPATDRAEWGDRITCELFERDLRAVCDCEAIALLEGWQNSRGAKMEIAVAQALGKLFYDARTMAHIGVEATIIASLAWIGEAVDPNPLIGSLT